MHAATSIRPICDAKRPSAVDATTPLATRDAANFVVRRFSSQIDNKIHIFMFCLPQYHIENTLFRQYRSEIDEHTPKTNVAGI
jgi:flagellar motor switch protein FliM